MSVAALIVLPVLHHPLSHEHPSIASSDADSNACFVYSDGSKPGSPTSGTCPICVTSGRARSLLPTVAELGGHSVPQRPRWRLREVRAGVGIPSLAMAPPRAPPLPA